MWIIVFAFRPKTTTAAPTTTTEEVTQGYEEEAVELPVVSFFPS